MNYTWLLLDADGTLFDYDKAEAAALEKTFKYMGHSFESGYADIYRRINKQIWLDFEQGKISQTRLRSKRFELFLKTINIESDPVLCSKKYLKHLGDGAYLIKGAEEILRALYGKMGLLLITNGLKEVQRSRLAKSTIGEYFADVVISDEIGAAKPDGRIFDVAFSKMDNPRKEEVLIVGDSLTSDIKGGSDYGIDTCWFNPDQKPRDLEVAIRYEICHLSELLSIVGVA
jgi:YjjG family noncanonical pyrimidine nucleotidase